MFNLSICALVCDSRRTCVQRTIPRNHKFPKFGLSSTPTLTKQLTALFDFEVVVLEK